jgi:putative colanic acid biosynthesis glycosyltransferase
MKILQINSVFGKGSTGRIAQDLHSELKFNEYESYIIYGRGRIVKEGDVFRVSNRLFFLIDVALTRLTGFIGIFSPFPTWLTKKRIVELNPDVIHIHNIHGYYININEIIDFIGKLKIPLVITMHDEFLYTGKCAYTENCDRYLIGCGECPLVKSYPKSLYFDFSRKMLDSKKTIFNKIDNLTLVTPSDWLKEKSSNTFLNKHNIHVINNGIDLIRFAKQDRMIAKDFLNLRDKKIILAVIANLDDSRKGAFWLDELSQRIIEGFEIVCVGEGKTKFQRDNIRYLNTSNDVALLSSYYSSADLFLILSQFENYPTVCLEASSFGIPIVGFDVGGVEEAINNVPYKLFDYGDIDNLASTINSCFNGDLKALDNPKTKDISKQRMLDEYLDLYRGVISDC